MDEERRQRHDDNGSPTYRQWEKTAAAVGEILTAIRGNDMGTTGLVDQVEELRDGQEKIKLRLDAFEMKQQQIEFSDKIKGRYQKALFALGGGIVIHFLEQIAQHFFK